MVFSSIMSICYRVGWLEGRGSLGFGWTRLRLSDEDMVRHDGGRVAVRVGLLGKGQI